MVMKKTRLLFFAFSFLFFFIFTNSCTIAADSLNPNNKLRILDSDESIISIETCDDNIFCNED